MKSLFAQTLPLTRVEAMIASFPPRASLMRPVAFLAFFAACSTITAVRADTPDYSRVVSTVTLSFEGGEMDRAALVENGDAGADLYIYRALEPNRTAPPKPALVKTNAAWSGAMWGTRPSLEVSDKGSLLIKSGNEAIGRSRWSQTVTVVYRDKQFIVAGLTYEWRDTFDLNANGVCDINFLTGKGMRKGKPIAVKTPVPKLADWSDQNRPDECDFP